MKFAVFLDVDGVLNTRTTVEHNIRMAIRELMMQGLILLQRQSGNMEMQILYSHLIGKN